MWPSAERRYPQLTCIRSVAGAIGQIAADKREPSKFRTGMNLQFGMIAAACHDEFLMASDGLWDTLDPVQVSMAIVRHCTAFWVVKCHHR